MLSVEQAFQRVREVVGSPVPRPVTVPLDEALGRVLVGEARAGGGAGDPTVFAGADALAVLPEGTAGVAGEEAVVDVILLGGDR